MNRVYRAVPQNHSTSGAIRLGGARVARPRYYVWCDPDPWLEGWILQPRNELEAIAREVYDSPEPTQVDTGLVDKNGSTIIREVSRNPIGFFADLDE